MLPLGDFNRDFLPNESEHQDPVYVERVSLRDALNNGDLLESLVGSIELVEPTFQVSVVALAVSGGQGGSLTELICI